MNLRGRVLTKYKDEFTEKHIEYQSCRNDSIGYEHHRRMNRLILDAFLIANREDIKKVAMRLYRNHRAGEVVERLVKMFAGYQDTTCGFIEVEGTDLGFDITPVEVSRGDSETYDIYIPELKSALRDIVYKWFREIEQNTLELKF